MPKNDPTRLCHMLEAANQAVTFSQGRSRSDLDDNRMLTLAIVKAIEIVGEAAARVSDDCRRRYPQIPWSNIISMRNRLIHACFDVDLDRVWDTVTDDLPPLIANLTHIVAHEVESQESSEDGTA